MTTTPTQDDAPDSQSPPQATPQHPASVRLDKKIQNPFLTTSDVIGHLNKAMEQVNQEQTKLAEKQQALLQNQQDENESGDEHDFEEEGDHNEDNDDAPSSTKHPLNLHNQQAHFELQRRLPDGSTRRATTSEQKAADLESKLQQVATQICLLPHSQQWIWLTQQQRPYGNELYASQQYAQAIDVYLTCVMVLQNLYAKQTELQKKSPTDEEAKDFDFVLDPLEHDILFVRIMNNLAQSALQLAWYKKAIQFCDLCLEQQQQQQSTSSLPRNDPTFLFQMSKLHFKRAKAHRLRGQYTPAKGDLRQSLDFIQQSEAALSKDDPESTLSKQLTTASKEIAKETRLIQQAIQEARKNEKRQQKAMRHVLGSSSSSTKRTGADEQAFESLDNDDFGTDDHDSPSLVEPATTTRTATNHDARPKINEPVAPLYEEHTPRTRTHSTLRSRTKAVMVDRYPHDPLTTTAAPQNEQKSWKDASSSHKKKDDDDGQFTTPRLTYWQYYWAVVGRVAENLLIWLGDEETIEKYKRLEREQSYFEDWKESSLMTVSLLYK